jgi:septum formation protein
MSGVVVVSSAVVVAGSGSLKPLARDFRLDFWRGLCLVDMVLVHLVYEGVKMGRVLQPTLGEYIRFAAGGFIFLAGLGVSYIFLPKAMDDEEVRACLKLLSGRRHQVITAVALVTPQGKLRTRVAVTRVSLLRLSERQVADYIESREGVGKAGGYAIQGRAEMWIKEISGSYSNVVGLPLALTVALLEAGGHG